MNIFKKTNNKETKKLPMTGKVKKGFRAYCAVVLCMALIGCMSMTAFAASGDPLTVINNLSDFIFGLIRAIGLILLGFGIVQVGLSLKSHDPSQRANGFLTLAGCIFACELGRNQIELGNGGFRRYVESPLQESCKGLFCG